MQMLFDKSLPYCGKCVSGAVQLRKQTNLSNVQLDFTPGKEVPLEENSVSASLFFGSGACIIRFRCTRS